jgi:beta-N-acetylhexosaminidase
MADKGRPVGPEGDATGMVDRRLMLAFEGTEPPERILTLLGERDVAGFTLFPHINVDRPQQVRALTTALQAGRRSRDPLLIAADQEGGQLVGLGAGTTQFAGNMALGATGDADLAERVGRAVGRELLALGVNVNYAPVCDVATNPANPSLGIRSFGDDPELVARLATAMVKGLQSQGVAATVKHFPGKGDASVDPHLELPRLDLTRERLEEVELVPFRGGIAAGVRLLMAGHYAVPRLTGREDLPSSLSRRVLHDLVREELGFEGVVITDALDMRALAQGGLEQAIDVIAAVRAGADLLLCTSDPLAQDRIRAALLVALSRELLDPDESARSIRRVYALRDWIGRFPQPDLEVVASADHQNLARELAQRSVTLIRDDAGLLPFHPPSDARVAAIMPRPQDLTPADTSSSVAPGLGAALRRHHPLVDEFVTTQAPSDQDVAALRESVRHHDLLVMGTIDASSLKEQAAMVAALLSTGIPTVAVALRTPHDLVTFPHAPTYVCSFGILPPTLDALADSLFGEIPFRGRLPAAIPGLYPTGHGLVA